MRSLILVGIVGVMTMAVAGCASSTSPAAQGATPKATAAKPARTAEQIPMSELMDNPKAAAVFAKHAPALAGNPQLSMAREMTLADVAGYAEAGLSPEMVRAIVDDINKL
jgi:hypothetical protein